MGIRFRNGAHAFEKQELVLPTVRGEAKNPMANPGARLVAELQRVGWDVPGLDLEFTSHPTSDGVKRKLHTIAGRTSAGPFRFVFDDSETRYEPVRVDLCEIGTPPGYRFAFGHDLDHRLRVAKQRYEGDDWFGEGAEFLAGFPSYEPERRPQHAEGHCRSVVESLIHKLEAMPTAPGHDDLTEEGDANLRSLAAVERIPVPADFPKLYAWLPTEEIHRARETSHGAILPGDGVRLSARTQDSLGRLRDEAWNGYSYAGPALEPRAGHCVHGSFDEFSAPIEVSLSCLNDVWVVDNSRLAQRRQEILEATGKDRLDDSELDECITAVARSMVPAAEYAGGYAEPVYAIGRRIFADEARPMKGVVEVREAEDGVTTSFEDTECGTVVLFHGRPHPSQVAIAKQVASRVGYCMNGSHSWRHRVDTPSEATSLPTP